MSGKVKVPSRRIGVLVSAAFLALVVIVYVRRDEEKSDVELDEARALQLAQSYFDEPTPNPAQLKVAKARHALSQVRSEELAASSFKNEAHGKRTMILPRHGLAISAPKHAMMLSSSDAHFGNDDRDNRKPSKNIAADKAVSMEASKLVNRAFDSAAIDLSSLKASEIDVKSAALARLQAKHENGSKNSDVKEGIPPSKSSNGIRGDSKAKGKRDDSLKELLSLMQPPSHATVSKDVTMKSEVPAVSQRPSHAVVREENLAEPRKERAVPMAKKGGSLKQLVSDSKPPHPEKEDSLKELLSLILPSHHARVGGEKQEVKKTKTQKSTKEESVKQLLSSQTVEKSDDEQVSRAKVHGKNEKLSSPSDVSAMFKQALHRKSLIDFDAFKDKREGVDGDQVRKIQVKSLRSVLAGAQASPAASEEGVLGREDEGMFDEAFSDAFVPVGEAQDKTLWDN
ncbi:hypothetical protein GUITHDRAFT_112306 [Guillardia theta CCMP2712]|uniref:Uncharacterized protein n=2 Tax=Guillardia theta TaxID=55529 RepID=L1IZC3_GUITC|nr:hypothetical protein GUITHDRAFT_112306 [Guillardia theta CCMP2712]EKX41596.1 hypothetical protein GUITHDRAFT_112306 [Guillardia theta CCMP2712]|eukprot:XP_005828576.1 hypothetical protein GUITHDRAFT_112306 [Guillardia theta CCMP2712]